jgi:hypothetical protein
LSDEAARLSSPKSAWSFKRQGVVGLLGVTRSPEAPDFAPSFETLIPDCQRFAISRANSMGIKGVIELCLAPPCQSYSKNLPTIHLRHEVLGQYLRALF